MIERLIEFHASPQQCLDMAGRAGVEQVVLTHHLPEARLDNLDRSEFRGKVHVGADLDTIVV